MEDKCKRDCKTMLNLQRHLETEHGNEQIEDVVNNTQDIIINQETENCFKCSMCDFSGNRSDIDKHFQAVHENTSTMEPFPCEVCGLVLANFEVLQDHMDSRHNQLKVNCRYCDYEAKDEESWHGHLVDKHEEYVILHSMAKQVDHLTDGSESFDKFKVDVLDTLKAILENQNQIKQEMFLIRNNQYNTAPKPDVIGSAHGANSTPTPSDPSPPQSSSSATQSESKMPSVPQQKEPIKRTNVFIVGDSISDVLDTKSIAKSMDAQVRTARAYTALVDAAENEAKEETRFPSKSFQNVIDSEIGKIETDVLIVQSGSVDISNLKTKGNDVRKYGEYFRQQTVLSASNLFTAVSNALITNNKLNKAIILKQVPRYDPYALDPQGIKSALVQLYNDTIVQLWLASSLMNKITIGNHDLECSGGVREARYRSKNMFDGLHLRGPSGSKSYTESVLFAVKDAGLIKNPPAKYFHRFHNQADQPEQRNNAQNTQAQADYIPPTQKNDCMNGKDIRKKNQTAHHYSVPTANRFTYFSQGNC